MELRAAEQDRQALTILSVENSHLRLQVKRLKRERNDVEIAPEQAAEEAEIMEWLLVKRTRAPPPPCRALARCCAFL